MMDAICLGDLGLFLVDIESVRHLAPNQKGNEESGSPFRERERLEIRLRSGQVWTVSMASEGAREFWAGWTNAPRGTVFDLEGEINAARNA